MAVNQQDDTRKSGEEKVAGGNFGNASNPSPFIRENDQTASNQLLNEKAEKYIRESGNIEDMPDPQEQQDAEKMMDNENSNNS